MVKYFVHFIFILIIVYLLYQEVEMRLKCSHLRNCYTSDSSFEWWKFVQSWSLLTSRKTRKEQGVWCRRWGENAFRSFYPPTFEHVLLYIVHVWFSLVAILYLAFYPLHSSAISCRPGTCRSVDVSVPHLARISLGFWKEPLYCNFLFTLISVGAELLMGRGQMYGDNSGRGDLFVLKRRLWEG